MILGVFAGHADFAQAAVRSAEQIIGSQSDYVCISNKGRSAEDIEIEMNEILENHEFEHCFIFVDFYGSSATVPAIKAGRSFSGVTVMFGYNLPLVIDFFLHRKKKNPDELKLKLLEIGRDAVK